MTKSELSAEQAQRLLVPIGKVTIEQISVESTINDVFRVMTRDHGSFYIKLHTARWYADQPDTFFVVNRECATHELLRKRGMPLPYLAWADYTRNVVPRSAYVCGELPGISVPTAIARYPQEEGAILKALGRYVRRLHEIEFTSAGLLEPAHACFAPAEGPIPPIETWHGGALHHPEHLQRDASRALDKCRERGLLPALVERELDRLFGRMVETIGPDYVPPRFTVGNCHAWHFHVDRVDGEWAVQGFYDFEAVSAGDPTIDLVELEMTLTPCTGSHTWREPFFEGYGSRPSLEGYKMRLFYYVLYEMGKQHSRAVPDAKWLRGRWPDLLQTSDWGELAWFPIEARE
jgi:aminoglycoside phosphotransferase